MTEAERLENKFKEQDTIISNLYKKIEIRDTLLNQEKALTKQFQKKSIRLENEIIKSNKSLDKFKKISLSLFVLVVVETLIILIK